MRILVSALLFFALPCLAATYTFHIAGKDPGSWPTVLSSLGLTSAPVGDVSVIPSGAPVSERDWPKRVEQGTILILEGFSPLADSFGFRPAPGHVIVRSVEDVHEPKIRIVWEKSMDIPKCEIPKDARVFARERWDGIPLVAGFRRGSGAILWVAASPGQHGYDRFPYLPQALTDLGFEAPFRSSRLWAFFDAAYRSRVDLDYFAPRWRKAGIAALHVAAWHYWEHDVESDEYLRHLIDACHRNGIQVYAWLELPHVSERFWDDHPEWREKTALLQDAQLDWRRLMNLTNRDAFVAVAKGVDDLIERFNWDGVNLAELYFESLEGQDNPARFTPFDENVRFEFGAEAGFDPLELFDSQSPRNAGKSPDSLSRFLEFRAELARRQQVEWINQIEKIRIKKPWLDLTLTHVDDRFDASMREKIGADTSKTLPLLDQHDFTFLIEDPATIWNLGPQRYPQIAAKYADLTQHADKLAIDINIVERYQDVYPTKQQTGSELFELLHLASSAFARVALYFENSILNSDLPLLPAAASTVSHFEQAGTKFAVNSLKPVGMYFQGPVLVDGIIWPIASNSVVWLPGGTHTIEPTAIKPSVRLIDLNADLSSALAIQNGIEFTYQSSARAPAIFDQPIERIEIDGSEAHPEIAGNALLLPRGQHFVRVIRRSDTQSAQ